MNNKGQMGVQGFMLVFIGVIVGLILFQAVAQYAGSVTTTTLANNDTYTAVGINQEIELTGQEYISGAIVTNASDGYEYTSDNYTITETVHSDGVKGITLTVLDNDLGNATSINVSMVYGDDGYIESAGTRSIVSLIAIFFALAVVVVALSPVLQSKLLEAVGR